MVNSVNRGRVVVYRESLIVHGKCLEIVGEIIDSQCSPQSSDVSPGARLGVSPFLPFAQALTHALKELREEAVKMITEGGMRALEVAQGLSIPKSTITYLVRTGREGTLSRVGSQAKPLTDEQAEVAGLRIIPLAYSDSPETDKPCGV
jgi:hypothetical protein